MTTVYTSSNERLNLNDSDLVGSGGEGSVFKDPQDPKSLIKIYENPTAQHGQKLSDFLSRGFKLGKQIAAPVDLVYNGRGSVIGFRMPFFKKTYPFRKLSDRKFRTSEKIGNKDVAQLHLNFIETLKAIHPQGLVVGDANDLNTLFKDHLAISIDVDSWQFAHWPCAVATENFLNPRLYSVDLSIRPMFTPLDDWYSFAVMLHKSLLRVHPYGGTHPTFAELPMRALKKITVRDKGVIYPAVGLNPDVLSDDLSEVFHRFFKLGKIDIFPEDILKKYSNGLTKCPSCEQEYPNSRRVCPVCNEQNQASLNITIPGSVTYQALLNIKGNIIFHKLEGQSFLAISIDNGFAFLHIVSQLESQTISLFPFQKGTRFDLSSNLLVVNDDQSDILNVYQVNGDQVITIGQTNADVYAGNNQAIFRVNGKHLYRMVGSQLVDTTIQNGQFLNRSLRQVIANQTWFTTNNDINSVSIGFHRVLRQQFFWLSREGFSTDLKLPFLETGEGLLDISIKFSSQEILILRKTKQGGKEYIRLDRLDQNGKILNSSRLEASSLPSESIHGLAFSRGNLIYPTDQGAVRLSLGDNNLAHFSGTGKLVTTNHSLYLYQQGLLVVGPKSVHYLTLN